MSTIVLALDTATEVTAVAVGRRDGDVVDVLAFCDTEAPRAAMSRLLPCTEDLVASLDLTPRDIGEVVVGRGPGSFTGVRIGVATAKGIAHGLGVPLYGVGTLDAIAWRIAGDREAGGGGEVLLGVVGDAMRGEVYPARFRVANRAAERLEGDVVEEPDSVAEAWAREERPLLLAGNGLHKYRDAFESALGALASVAPVGLWSPSGVGLLAAYASARRRGELESGDPGALLPIYTRLSDAEEAEHQRRGLHGDASESTKTAGARVRREPATAPESGVRGPLGGSNGASGAGR